MNLQIETIITKDGRKMDVIRDIAAVRALIAENRKLFAGLIRLREAELAASVRRRDGQV